VRKKPGFYKGKHYTEYVEAITSLKRKGRYDDAESLLLMLLDATEEEDCVEHMGVAPWYYEQLAIIYRKQLRYADEITVLERFAKQRHAPGVQPPKLIERLSKAKGLLEKQQQRKDKSPPVLSAKIAVGIDYEKMELGESDIHGLRVDTQVGDLKSSTFHPVDADDSDERNKRGNN